jgi:hypothetical protein
MKLKATVASLVVACALVPGVVAAQTLPNASTFNDAGSPFVVGPPEVIDATSDHYDFGSLGTADASTNGFPRPSSSVTASGVTAGSSEFRYFFEILAADPTLIVPVNLIGDVVTSAQSTPTSYATAHALIQIGNTTTGQIFQAEACTALGPFDACASSEPTASVAFSTQLLVPVDQIFQVVLQTRVVANGVGSFGSAFSDPFIGIDPNFFSLNPDLTLDFSPGVGDAPFDGVPEPGAWALEIMGFGLMGAAMRRRRMHWT